VRVSGYSSSSAIGSRLRATPADAAAPLARAAAWPGAHAEPGMVYRGTGNPSGVDRRTRWDLICGYLIAASLCLPGCRQRPLRRPLWTRAHQSRPVAPQAGMVDSKARHQQPPARGGAPLPSLGEGDPLPVLRRRAAPIPRQRAATPNGLSGLQGAACGALAMFCRAARSLAVVRYSLCSRAFAVLAALSLLRITLGVCRDP